MSIKEMVLHILFAIIELLIAWFILKLIVFSSQKSKEYGDDERWQFVKLRAAELVGTYYYIIFGIAGFSFISLIILNSYSVLIKNKILSTANISLLGLLFCIMSIFQIACVIEYFALKYYDENM